MHRIECKARKTTLRQKAEQSAAAAAATKMLREILQFI